MGVERLSAITLVVVDMARSVAFYDALGLRLLYGGADAAFTSYAVGDGYLNLQLDAAAPRPAPLWGRAILYVDDVDAVHARVRAAGYEPEMAPSDAPWGERYFHVRDPDGHELSFAKPFS
jgi:catechol 2,3-dioxygenase-like lactoylglutathione lyase family enzyme